MASASSELESFRQRWLEEVSGRVRSGSCSAEAAATTSSKGQELAPGPDPAQIPPKPPSPLLSRRQVGEALAESTSPSVSERESSRETDVALTRKAPHEPRSALEHYETAVEKEAQGRLGDSLKHYRQAYKLDSAVDKSYKKKYFPAPSGSSKAPQADANPKLAKASGPARKGSTSSAGPLQPTSISELIRSFSTLSTIPAAAAPSLADTPIPPINDGDEAAAAATEEAARLPCPIANLPSEVLIEILFHVALTDMSMLGRLAQVCKRLAYLVALEERIWQRLCCGPEVGFGGMYYSWAYDCVGRRLVEYQNSSKHQLDQHRRHQSELSPPTYLPVPLSPKYPTYVSNLRYRPRIRFNGCYISTVNYVRSGAASATQVSWNSPVFIVTYYRYLRFFRDGTVISLVSNHEPSEVVYHLKKENLPFRSSEGGHGHSAGSGSAAGNPSSHPTSMFQHAAIGRWRLGACPVLSSLPASSSSSSSSSSPSSPSTSSISPRTKHELEHGCTRDSKPFALEDRKEGQGRSSNEEDIFIESEGLNTTYMFAMHLSIQSSSSGARSARGGSGGVKNNKLTWESFWSYNREMDVWHQFSTVDGSPFFWSRVKSYGFG